MTAEERMLSLFSNKRVLIVVPHEDDEINVAGTILAQLDYTRTDVMVVFSTDGGRYISPKRRMVEARKALNYCGVKNNQILFLGYPDFDDRIERSLEVKKQMEHDLLECIENFSPDFIFTNGSDEHPNHIELSDIIDEVYYQYLKDDLKSHVFLFKTYAYNLAYYAVDDYSRYNLLETKDRGKDMYPYSWEERLRLPVPRKCRTNTITTNFIYRAMWRHHSQSAYRATSRIANSDKVYWLAKKNSEENNNNDIWFCKICINDNYVYDYYTEDCFVELSLISFGEDGRLIALDSDKISYYVIEEKSKRIIKSRISKRDFSNNSIVVYAEYDGIDMDEIQINWKIPAKPYLLFCKMKDCIIGFVMKTIDWGINEIYRAGEIIGKIDE